MTTFIEPPFWASARSEGRQHVGLSLYVAPVAEPLTAAEVKAQLRLDSTAGEPAPGLITAALASPAIAGNVTAGAHRYLATFVTADGETEAGAISAAVTVSDAAVNGKVTLTAIPLGGAAVTARKLYRTAAGGSIYLLLATLADNTTTTYTDNIADASLGAQAPTTNTTADPQLLAWITAARQLCEIITDCAFMPQTWRQTFSYLPAFPITLQKRPVQLLPTPPVITYIDTAGVTQTWATTEYTVDAPAGPYPEAARILPAYGQTVFPTTSSALLNTVTIQYVAGFANAAAVPAIAKQAMLLLVGFWWANRGDVTSDAWRNVREAVEGILGPMTLMVVA